MKDSGIEWIGEIPEEWTIAELKMFCIVNNGKEIINEVDKCNIDAIPVYGSGGIFKYTDNFMHDGTVVMFGRKGTLGKPIHVTGRFWVVDTMYYLTYMESLNPKYNYYQLLVFNWEPHITQTALPSVVASQIISQKFAFPPTDEQKNIVAYLDKKCAEIDAVLEKTRESIEEYKKLKQAVITEAVTKGVRGNREMKDSGVEWIVEIPVEWNTINPKALFTQRKDKAKAGEKQLTASQQYGVIYQDEYMKLTGAKVVTVEKDFDILKHVECGDFVISMRSFQGGLEYSTNTGSISSAYVMLIPNLDLVFPRFFKWLLKSQIYINALQSTSNLVRDGQAMRYSNFAQVRLYTVPIDEQQEIADYLDKKITEIDTLIAKKEALLEELETYKKSLIYEYVTGKKRL